MQLARLVRLDPKGHPESRVQPARRAQPVRLVRKDLRVLLV